MTEKVSKFFYLSQLQQFAEKFCDEAENNDESDEEGFQLWSSCQRPRSNTIYE